MDKSFELGMSQEYRSSENILVLSGSPKRSTKITARPESLLAIHRKISLHLRNEKTLRNFELRKLLSILKRIDCSSPRDQKVAQSAHDILIKCIYSQESKREKIPRRNIITSSDSTSEPPTPQSKSDGSYANHQKSFVEEETNSLASHVALSEIFLRRHRSINSNTDMDKFENQESDNNIFNNKWSEINSKSDKTVNAPFTVPTLIEKEDPCSFSQQPNILKLRFADVQFDSDTVSIPMELLTNLNFGSGERQSQGQNCKRRESSQEKRSYNKLTFPERNTQNSVISTFISEFTKQNDINLESNNNSFQISPFNAVNEDLSQNRFIFTQSGLFPNQDSSLKNTNNIESANSKQTHSISAYDKQQNENLDISSSSTNVESSVLNIERYSNSHSDNLKETRYTTGDGNCNLENSKLQLKVPLVRHSQYIPRKHILCGTAPNIHTDNFKTVPSNNEHAEQGTLLKDNIEIFYDSFQPGQNITKINNGISNATVTNIDAVNSDKAWCIPSNIVSDATNDYSNASVTNSNSKHFDNDGYKSQLRQDICGINQANCPIGRVMSIENLSDVKNNVRSETPDLQSNRMVPMEDVMEMDESWMDDQGDLEMSDVEKRYLEMAANSAESETIDFICKENKISSVVREANVNETDGGSFVFNLDTDYSSDIIEATPYNHVENKTFHKKIKTLPPKKLTAPAATNNPIILNETEDIIIDETPCESNSQSPNIVMKDMPCLAKSPVQPRVKTPIRREHTMINPYKKWSSSKSFQEIYNKNYRRKCPKTTSDSSKINILKNITISNEGVTQSQSLGILTAEDKNAERLMEKPALLDMSNSLSLTNISSNSIPSPSSDHNCEREPNLPKTQEMSESEPILLIDGTNPKNTDKMDITPTESEKEETYEEKMRKLEEKILRKRNKYRETWEAKPLTEKVSLKYVKEFNVNIFEDPVDSLLNIGYQRTVDKFHIPRLTAKEMNEKLRKSSENANLLNEALTKMVDHQISSASKEDYHNKIKCATQDLDSDDSSDDEETQRKKKLEEIKIMSRLGLKEFKEKMEKKIREDLNKDNNIMEESSDDAEEKTEIGGTSKLIQDLRKAGDFSWLK